MQQKWEPTALGTRLLSAKGPDRWIPPPQPARRPPILRPVAGDARSVRPLSAVADANPGPTIAPPALAVVYPPSARSSVLSDSSEEDYIPIVHKPSHRFNGKKQIVRPPIAVIIPPTPSDDGFTPITPTTASPRLKDYRLSRAPPLPRDALGISVGKIVIHAKSKKVQVHHEDDDATPLSPANDRDAEVQVAAKPKPRRKTLWGVIEGWWDLGLLERGKSFRR
ncbi:hypothetical protein F5Y11DRAFT_77835 [Daldinia sp. FL1419]|nr:hypothetical protein F5Y11DRAFT_77835 [Daldinia sp. FL1419]